MAADLQEGRDYKLISPPLDTIKGKIEVIEFFSYGCPHCKDFNPHVEKWAAALPKDVTFRRVPITFNRAAWVRIAKLYYALEMTGNLTKLDAEVFKAIHDERTVWNSDESVVAWATGKGVDGKKIAEAMGSFTMQSRIQRGDQDSVAARIAGVPSLVIAGKYLVNNEATHNHGDHLKLADAVIAKLRQEQKSKK
jgi:thiol:disulfide interchange protein DsbA